jgi:hypothetical protein
MDIFNSKEKIVCLTGDVHHMTMHGKDQKHLNCTELESAVEYANIAKSYGIKSTLFLTGKSVMEECNNASDLVLNNFVEVGGHTYSAFKPLLIYRLSHVLLNRKNGPYFFQNYQVKKTIKIFKNLLNISIDSWRDHGYREDKNTKGILVKNGIKFISNDVNYNATTPLKSNGIISVAINTFPDHDYIFHGDYLNEQCCYQSEKKPGDLDRRVEIEEWLDNVKNQVELITNNGGCATLLVHPACMKITDNFKTFEKLCGFLQDYRCVTISELENEQ